MADTTVDTIESADMSITSDPEIRPGRTSLVQPHDNPFTADGELSSKADYILRHSKISRTEIHIVDPDSPPPVVEEEVVLMESSQQQSAPPPRADPASEPLNKTNGQVDEKPKDGDIANGDKDKDVKPAKKKGTCKCCSIM